MAKAKAPAADVAASHAGHARVADIERLREALLAAHPGLQERVKWNAPSHGLGDDDRITFRLQPGDRVELVFHRGAKKRTDPFSFEDPTGLLKWQAPDRALLAFPASADVKRHEAAVTALAKAWLAATA